MAELPEIPNVIPEVRAPQSRVSPAQVASPYQELAANLDKAGHALNDSMAVPLAHQAGLEAVTRDENGNVRVERAPIIGDAAIAYQRAVKVAAVAEGESHAKMRNIELRNEFKDDPGAYLKAATAYKNDTLQSFKAAGKEVQFALGKSIDSLATETYRGLLNQKETRDLYRASRAIEAQIEDTKNEMAALANGGDTSSPDFLSRASKIKALYGELVANPRLAYPQERADFEVKHFDSQLRAQALAHDIAGPVYDQRGPEAAAQAAQKILTDPQLNLTPGQRDAFYYRAVGAVNARVNAENRVNKGIATEIDAVGKMAAEGYAPDPQRMAGLAGVVGESKNPGVQSAYRGLVAALPIMADWRRMSPAQLETQLAGLSKAMREQGGTEQGIALLKNGQKLLDGMRKGLKDDPLDWANRTGTMPVPAIDFGGSDPAADMRARIAAAETIAQHYGIKPQYLTPDERHALSAVAAQGGPQMLSVAQSLSQGFGDRAPRVLAEISKDAPTLAHLGGLLTGSLFGGGSVTFANDVAEAVALRRNKEVTLPHWATTPNDKVLLAERDRTANQYGDVFLLAQPNRQAAETSARDAFLARAMRNNWDASKIDGSSADSKGYDRALQEAAGATFTADGSQYGGVTSIKPGVWSNYKVLVPGHVRADKFKDVLGAITDDDLQQKLPVSPQAKAEELRRAVPVATVGGYRFAAGDPASSDPKWVQGADGQPFVLDLNALERVLRQRVPGAFIGQR